MGAERYGKESVIDMKDDIQLIAEYLAAKLGSTIAAVQRECTYSKMAEMDLDKEKVGWYLMATAGEKKLKEWLQTAIDKGELGAVGDAPPDLLAELELDADALDAGEGWVKAR